MNLLLKLFPKSFSKQKPLDAFKTFLQHDAGASIRQAPHQKERKYIHVQISQQFKRQEQQRKQIRLEQMKTRRMLLQQKVTTESKLLTSAEDEELAALGGEIASLEALLQNQEKQLQDIDKSLEESQASMVLIQGPKKLVVLNKIEYLRHMTRHPTGMVLHPTTIEAIENVHYLVNNNLPVSRIKLFEFMPELFQTEINELQQSMQKLIAEKSLDPESDPSSRIRFFVRHKSRFSHPQQPSIDLMQQRQAVFNNMQQQIVRLMQPHMPYVRLVEQGRTPFRSTYHMITTLLSDVLHLTLSPQQQALKATLQQIVQMKDDFQSYSLEIDKKMVEVRHRYIEPPEWVKNHPLLLQRYQQIMVKYTNPEKFEDTLKFQISNDDGGRAYLSAKLNQLVIEKYHPIIEELWNSGKREELIATRKRLEIDFYNDSTRILEEYNESLLEQKEKEEFLKIPKKSRELPQQTYLRLTLDNLTKTIVVNNSNPSAYGVAFFTRFLGLQDEEDARKLFNSFSYLRVKEKQPEQAKGLDFEIIKFRET